MQRESRCVRSVAEQPLYSRLLSVHPTFIVVWTAAQNVEHLWKKPYQEPFLSDSRNES